MRACEAFVGCDVMPSTKLWQTLWGVATVPSGRPVRRRRDEEVCHQPPPTQLTQTSGEAVTLITHHDIGECHPWGERNDEK